MGNKSFRMYANGLEEAHLFRTAPRSRICCLREYFAIGGAEINFSKCSLGINSLSYFQQLLRVIKVCNYYLALARDQRMEGQLKISSLNKVPISSQPRTQWGSIHPASLHHCLQQQLSPQKTGRESSREQASPLLHHTKSFANLFTSPSHLFNPSPRFQPQGSEVMSSTLKTLEYCSMFSFFLKLNDALRQKKLVRSRAISNLFKTI